LSASLSAFSFALVARKAFACSSELTHVGLAGLALGAGFFAAAGFLAAGFLAAGFLAAGFLAAGFLEVTGLLGYRIGILIGRVDCSRIISLWGAGWRVIPGEAT
jgi:hypothetical protein